MSLVPVFFGTGLGSNKSGNRGPVTSYSGNQEALGKPHAVPTRPGKKFSTQTRSMVSAPRLLQPEVSLLGVKPFIPCLCLTQTPSRRKEPCFFFQRLRKGETECGSQEAWQRDFGMLDLCAARLSQRFVCSMMKRPATRALGKQQIHRCGCCGASTHRLESCAYPGAKKMQQLQKIVATLKHGAAPQNKGVVRKEKKWRKSSKLSAKHAAKARAKYSKRTTTRKPSPAEVQRRAQQGLPEKPRSRVAAIAWRSFAPRGLVLSAALGRSRKSSSAEVVLRIFGAPVGGRLARPASHYTRTVSSQG